MRSPLATGRFPLVVSRDVDDQTRPDQTDFVKLVNVQAAKTHLSRLLEEAVAGEEIVIAKAGRPYVRLTPVTAERTPRVFGHLKGKIRIAADFDDTPSEVIALFEGRPVAMRRR